MNFENLPKGLSLDELREIAKERFRELRRRIFDILPEECLLKPKRVIHVRMLEMIDVPMIQQGIIAREDICALCEQTKCPYFHISDRDERIRKIELLNKKPDN